jgi:hypothetical protein
MKTMARKLTRSRKYSPEVITEEFVRAAFKCLDWDKTEEVSTLFYISKGLVQGRRAADELWLDWAEKLVGGWVGGASSVCVHNFIGLHTLTITPPPV